MEYEIEQIKAWADAGQVVNGSIVSALCEKLLNLERAYESLLDLCKRLKSENDSLRIS